MDANYNYKHNYNYNLNHNNNHKLHFLHGGARFSGCFVENSVENLLITCGKRRRGSGAEENHTDGVTLFTATKRSTFRESTV